MSIPACCRTACTIWPPFAESFPWSGGEHRTACLNPASSHDGRLPGFGIVDKALSVPSHPVKVQSNVLSLFFSFEVLPPVWFKSLC